MADPPERKRPRRALPSPIALKVPRRIRKPGRSSRPLRLQGSSRMLARIYRPAKSAMQQGTAKTKVWVLEFEPASARTPDPLMGWTSSADMNGQVRLLFESPEEAATYATAHGIAFQLFQPKTPRKIIKAYADNFAFQRKQPWTH